MEKKDLAFVNIEHTVNSDLATEIFPFLYLISHLKNLSMPDICYQFSSLKLHVPIYIQLII